MKSRYYSILFRAYLYVAAAILLFTGAIKVTTAFGHSPLLTMHDPLFQFMNNRTLFLSVGCLELAVALYLVMGRAITPKLWILLWLSFSFIAYRLGLAWSGVPGPCKCLGGLTDWLPVRQSLLDFALKFCLVFLFGGSIAMLTAKWLQQRRSGSTAVGLVGLP